MKKVISFDLWGTLIKSNPQYKEMRTLYLETITRKDKSEIENVLSRLKKDCDSRAEHLGIQMNIHAVYNILLNELGIHNLQQINTAKLGIIQLFKTYPPIVIDNATRLLQLLRYQDYRLIIASNNVMIPGTSMRTVLEDIGILQYFSGEVFSDEVGHSKPSIEFFKRVHERSATFASNIVHVGDNQLTDTIGAQKYGINSIEIYKGIFDDPHAFINIIKQMNNF